MTSANKSDRTSHPCDLDGSVADRRASAQETTALVPCRGSHGSRALSVASIWEVHATAGYRQGVSSIRTTHPTLYRSDPSLPSGPSATPSISHYKAALGVTVTSAITWCAQPVRWSCRG